MKTFSAISLALAAAALFGCDQQPGGPIEPGIDGLEAIHVSGHLGSYRDCPEQAYENQQAGAPEADAARFEGDCATDQCGPLNCEAARLTFTLSNHGDVAAEGITATLLILDREGLEVVELPVSATLAEDGSPFAGALAAGADALLHIEFAGPLDVEGLVGPPAAGDGDVAWQTGAQLRLVIEADGFSEAGFDTPELYSLPELDT